MAQDADLAAPYIHPKPQPEPRYVTLELPELLDDVTSLVAVHATLLRSVASGDLSLEEAREMSVILDNHRRSLELSDIESVLRPWKENAHDPHIGSSIDSPGG